MQNESKQSNLMLPVDWFRRPKRSFM